MGIKRRFIPESNSPPVFHQQTGSVTSGSRTRRPSGLLKGLLSVFQGSAYDRDPCPHAHITHDLIADPQRPDDLHRARSRRTEWRCERPGGHVHGKTAAERLHADAAGRTW